ncbi:MAG TPA: hypothetical protein DGG95_10615 [Cytophagales bacterium]|jgi:hypothetical protein|nr:hypothetical protein [Cytophagales bacterium]
MRLTLLLLLFSEILTAQEIKVEYDKKRDFSTYKTFSFGEGQVVLPPDQKQLSSSVIDKWIKNGVRRELESKGLQRVDSAADVKVSYVFLTTAREDLQRIGPLGQTPGSTATTWSRDYIQTSLIIDLNTKKDLIWRVNATVTVSGADGERVVDMVVEKGFKKFGKPSKKR